MQSVVGSSPGRVKQKTIELVFEASSLKTNRFGPKAFEGRHIRINDIIHFIY